MTTQHSKTTRTNAPAPRSRPLNAAARRFVARHGDPAQWTAQDWRLYAELGGIQ